MAKSPNLSAKIWYGLTVLIRFLILNLQAKFFKIYALSFGKISSKLYKFHAIRPQIPRMTQNSHHLFTYYTLCFRCLPQQRTPGNPSESSEIHSIRPQIPRIT